MSLFHKASAKKTDKRDLVRILACGSVDDGKSTLIGRLFFDAKMIAEDTLEALHKDSKTHGTTGGGFDPALLTDGLKAEREQGITIDVAYRYFHTPKRAFIVADTPGHEQYTRNMATAASLSNLAIILLDAKKGVLTQSRRHSFICSLLGIRHVIVAVNKMDLVNYDPDVFEKIREEFTAFAARLDMRDLHFVPMSALHGENVVEQSTNMPWYKGGTILHLLNTIHIASDRNLIDVRFPVQYVSRPTADYRGFSGTIASGILRKGDKVTILPSGKKSAVIAIDTYDGEKDEAFAPQAVTIRLKDEVDVSRGDMITHVNNVAKVGTQMEAMVVWMGEEPLTVGTSYLIRQTTKTVTGSIEALRYRMNVNTLHREESDVLHLNEVGRVKLKTTEPLCFDSYQRNRETGSFIIIDRLTNLTVGAGMITEAITGEEEASQKEPQSKTLRREESLVDQKAREKQLKQKPATLLLTGITGSGKSTVAHALEHLLFEKGHTPIVLDGENLRLGLNKDLGFSDSERKENVRRAMEVAHIGNTAGLIAIAALIAPTESIRNDARAIIGADRFLVVHLKAPIEVCEKRHDKGLYKALEKGHKHDVPGKTAPYEEPVSPDLILKTDIDDPKACAEKLLELLRKKGFLY